MKTRASWCPKCRGVVWVASEEDAQKRPWCDDCLAPKTLKVWDADNDEEPGEPNEQNRLEMELEAVAHRYASGEWWHSDYPTEMTIAIRDEHGALHRFKVTVEQVPQFTARRVS